MAHDPTLTWRVVQDAARLIRKGELIVFGSAALSFWLRDAPVSRDVDVWCEPRDRGELVEALMGEFSWYHDKHGTHVEVWGPETFKAPPLWRTRAKVFPFEGVPEVEVVVPHPHDVLIAKLERMDPKDQNHRDLILAQLPLSVARFDELVAEFPPGPRDPDREARFQHHAAALRSRLNASVA